MSKKVFIISSSLRTDSNSELLAKSFAKGAEEAGNKVEMISLKDKKIAFCKGCLACQANKSGRCIIKDDANAIAQKMAKADVIVFASPIYYYGLSGQLKTLLDRANGLYGSAYAFRDIYLLLSAADEGKNVPNKAITGLQGWIDCFEKASLVKTIFAGGVNNPGDIKEHPALRNAYKTGKKIQ